MMRQYASGNNVGDANNVQIESTINVDGGSDEFEFAVADADSDAESDLDVDSDVDEAHAHHYE